MKKLVKVIFITFCYLDIVMGGLGWLPAQTKGNQNVLMKVKLREAPVVNGLKQRIGTRAYITIPQKQLLEVVSLEDITEFYKSFEGKGYNWVSIICPEGTGLVFTSGGVATYGKVDEIGRVASSQWSIFYDESTRIFKKL